MGEPEGEAGPAAVRAEAEGGALLVAALLRCMRPSEGAGGGDTELQARWGALSFWRSRRGIAALPGNQLKTAVAGWVGRLP